MKVKLNKSFGTAYTAGELADVLAQLPCDAKLYLNDWNAGVAVQGAVDITPANTTEVQSTVPRSLKQNKKGEVNSVILGFWNEGRMELA